MNLHIVSACMVLCTLICSALSYLTYKKIAEITTNSESNEETEKRLDIIKENQTNQTNFITNAIAQHTNAITGKISAEQSIARDEIGKMRIELTNSLKSSGEENHSAIEKINKIVTEKLQSTLDEKLGIQNKVVSNNMANLSNGIKNDMATQRNELKTTLDKLNEGFTAIRNDMANRMNDMQKAHMENMDRINATVNEKLQKTLNDRITESFKTVTERLNEVHKGLGEMREIASGVTDLKHVLSNVKTRGTLGEIQLEAILSEILTKEQYAEQCLIDPEKKVKVDFAVKLPGANAGGTVYLPIDSKFPGDTYSKLMEAYETADAENIISARKALENTIKTEAKSIRDKYIVPPHTTDFAIMFLPFEGLYSEVVNMGLVDILQREFKINIAGPSTMAALLNSLRMGFKTLAIQKRSSEVWTTLEAVKKEFTTFEKGLNAMKKKIQDADKDIDDLLGTRTRAINKKLIDVSSTESLELADEILGITQSKDG